MSRFVRSSKYRHVFAKAEKREFCYDDVKVSRSAWDSNKAACNNTFIALAWEAVGGGSFAVLRHDQVGKQPAELPLCLGHKAPVLDLDWNPFNEHVIASCGEDATCKIWAIPEGGLTTSLTDPLQNLLGHRRKVGIVRWNPVASNVLATASTDYLVKVWEIEKGDNKLSIDGHTDIIQSLDWNHNGSSIVTSCKDKKIRIIDPRQERIAQETIAHQGVKGSRVIWLGDRGWLFSVGFSRTSERQFSIWDTKALDKPLASQNIDTSSGILMPFYDPDTCMIFLSGKGDGNIRYYELVDEKPYIHFVSEYKSATPTVGCARYPKTAVNVNECEIMRLLKVTTTGMEPISFIVPRKSDIFQDDIYPPTAAGDAALNADQWFGGQNGELKKISLQGGFTLIPKAVELKVEKKDEESGPKNEKELRDEYEKLKKRVAHLEAELTKKDTLIKDLQGK